MFVHKEVFDKEFDIGDGIFKYFKIEIYNGVYTIQYDDVLYIRYRKIYKLLKAYDKYIELFLKVIEFVIKNCISTEEYLTIVLSNELAKSINDEILKKCDEIST